MSLHICAHSQNYSTLLLGFRESKGILCLYCSSALDNWKIVSSSAVQGVRGEGDGKGGGYTSSVLDMFNISDKIWNIFVSVLFVFPLPPRIQYGRTWHIYRAYPCLCWSLLFSYFPTFHWGFNNIDYYIYCLLLNITSCVILRV